MRSSFEPKIISSGWTTSLGVDHVRVAPGKRIPGIPQHQLKLVLDYAPTAQRKVGVDLAAVESRYFAGDHANQNAKPGCCLVDLDGSCQFSNQVQLFGLCQNLLNVHDHGRRYEAPVPPGKPPNR